MDGDVERNTPCMYMYSWQTWWFKAWPRGEVALPVAEHTYTNVTNRDKQWMFCLKLSFSSWKDFDWLWTELDSQLNCRIDLVLSLCQFGNLFFSSHLFTPHVKTNMHAHSHARNISFSLHETHTDGIFKTFPSHYLASQTFVDSCCTLSHTHLHANYVLCCCTSEVSIIK